MRWLWLAFKPLPVLGLGVWVLGAPRSAYRNRVAAGLMLSLAGDVLIEASFVAGLAAFLLAHVAYIAAFLADTKRPRLLRALPIAAYGAGMTAFLWPRLGGMRAPVAIYVIAICTMVWRAAARVGGATGGVLSRRARVPRVPRPAPRGPRYSTAPSGEQDW